MRPQPKVLKERFRPVPLSLPILFPTPHALVIWFFFQYMHALETMHWSYYCSTAMSINVYQFIFASVESFSDLSSLVYDG